MDSQTNETLCTYKINNDWCYKVNQFEIVMYSYNEDDKEELIYIPRESICKATFYKIAGKMSIYFYALQSALDYLNTLNEGQKFHIKYMLYKQDDSGMFVLADDIMKLTEISSESLCYDSNNDLTIRLDFNRCTSNE